MHARQSVKQAKRSTLFSSQVLGAGVVLGSISILDSVCSLQYQSQFIFPSATQGGTAAAAIAGAQMLSGMWWRYAPQTSVFLSAANATASETRANVTVFDRLHRQLGTTAVALPPHGSSVTNLDGLIGSGPDAMLGSVAIEYQGKPMDLLFSGGIEDDEAGYSAALRLTMPMEMDAHAATSSSCNVASAGLDGGQA